MSWVYTYYTRSQMVRQSSEQEIEQRCSVASYVFFCFYCYHDYQQQEDANRNLSFLLCDYVLCVCSVWVCLYLLLLWVNDNVTVASIANDPILLLRNWRRSRQFLLIVCVCLPAGRWCAGIFLQTRVTYIAYQNQKLNNISSSVNKQNFVSVWRRTLMVG